MQFFEVKEGVVNNEILQTLKTSACPWTVNDFLNRRGTKGGEQMLRVIQQIKLSHQVCSFLREEKGFDPATGQEVEIVDTTDIPERHWDQELQQVLRSCESEDGTITRVDDSLWLFAMKRTNESMTEIQNKFEEQVKNHAHPTALKWMKEYKSGDSFPSIISLQQWVNYLPSRPLFCRDVAIEDMLAILKGTKIVMMCVDWSALAHSLLQLGITLEWSSRKEGRREKSKPRSDRLLLVGDQIPILKCGGAVMQLGDSQLIRIVFDGVRPSTLAASYKRPLDLLAQRSNPEPA